VRRLAAVTGALVVGFLALLLLAPQASAADTEYSIGGRLNNQVGTQKVPVPGVSVNVTGAGFTGSGTSAADGSWRVDVPAEGEYDVTLDQASLPSGIALTDPSRGTIHTTVKPPSVNRTVIFPLGESTQKTTSQWTQVAQLTVEGVRFGLLIALGAVGLSLIYGTTGLTNFAHGEMLTFGALMTWVANVSLHIPLVLAAIIGLGLSAGFGWLQNTALWRPLRKRGTGLLAMMIVSIGLALLLRNVFLFFVGGDKRAYAEFSGMAGLPLGPVSLTPSDLVSMVIALVALALVVIAVQKTRLGKATRAVADNPALASSAGIKVEGVIQSVWIVGALMAGLSGILLGFTQQVSYLMGFQVLLLIFAAVTLGGLGTIWGAIVGSLVVGLFLQLTTLIIPPELKNVGALLVLIVILLVRPYGLLGRSERVG